MNVILLVLGFSNLILLIVIFLKSKSRKDIDLKDEFRQSREELGKISKDNRVELSSELKEINKTLDEKIMQILKYSKESQKELQEVFEKNVELLNRAQKEKFEQLDVAQGKLLKSTEERLDKMRETVEEKLDKTLHERLGQSFDRVGKQLEAVHLGLGEMKTLAADVGGLKNVLGNVKMRGGLGEAQLSMLLEQILAPNQYERNVKTKKNSSDLVEFAIKLPGREEGLDHIWLPVDAKFPKDYYQELQKAHDTGDINQIEIAQRNLEIAIKKMAKDISEKYIDVPYTTDFAIMFLPFEGIYAEVVRKASLLEDIQRDYKIVITGPTTLSAILNSFHMGFRTLAIQKRSSEVWSVLGAVKTEFEKFEALLQKAQKNIQLGLGDIETLVGTRTRKINSKLKNVEALTDKDVKIFLPEISNTDLEE